MSTEKAKSVSTPLGEPTFTSLAEAIAKSAGRSTELPSDTAYAGKTVLVGVTGGIAAYKSCEIVRGLQKAGVHVKVVMTEHATHLVNPLTFRALTHESVAVDLFDDPADPIHHISLADEADVFVIAPATVNVIAKITHGIADDLLTTTASAFTGPLVICPAANVHMYESPANRVNMHALAQRGVTFVEADSGYLACGYEGRGRMAEPAGIVKKVLSLLTKSISSPPSNTVPPVGAFDVQTSHEELRGAHNSPVQDGRAAKGNHVKDLSGRSVLITAGPTVEPIDAVRYLSNFSSGKTGYALAAAAIERGAKVVLVSGPVALDPPADAALVPVRTANEMHDAVAQAFDAADIAIFSAAVADFRPAQPVGRKLKKGTDGEMLSCIELVENPDILACAGRTKTHQIVVGFAAETDDVLKNARCKLVAKHADFIVANQVGDGRAFGTDSNEVWLVSADGEVQVPCMPKRDLADVILDKALEMSLGSR